MPASDAEAPSAHSHDAHGAFHGERAAVPTDMPPVIQEVPQGQHHDARAEGIPAGLMDTFTHLKSLVVELDVEKDVDATETAVQGQPSTETVGHRANCPRGGSAPCGVAKGGHCELCNASVRDHEAVGKSAPPISSSTGALGIKVPEREHPTSDHHMTLGAKPGKCPHCGGILDLLDHQTEQGQPDRSEKQGATHKCVGTGLDVLKSLVTA